MIRGYVFPCHVSIARSIDLTGPTRQVVSMKYRIYIGRSKSSAYGGTKQLGQIFSRISSRMTYMAPAPRMADSTSRFLRSNWSFQTILIGTSARHKSIKTFQPVLSALNQLCADMTYFQQMYRCPLEFWDPSNAH